MKMNQSTEDRKMKLTKAGSLWKASATLWLSVILGSMEGCVTLYLPQPESGYLGASWPQDRLATKSYGQAGSCQFVRVQPREPPQRFWASLFYVPVTADSVGEFLLTVKNDKVVAEAAIVSEEIRVRVEEERLGRTYYKYTYMTKPLEQIILTRRPRPSIPPHARYPGPYCKLCSWSAYWFGMVLGIYFPDNILNTFFPSLIISGEKEMVKYRIVTSAVDSYIIAISQEVRCYSFRS